MEKANTCADEAALYGLCHMFSRHSLVYTVGSVWTTLNLTSQTSVQRIQAKCDLHFAFLDGGIIGILLRKPCVPRLISMGNTVNNPPPMDLSQKSVCKTNGNTNELGSDGLLNSSRGEYDFSFDSVAPTYDTPDVFSTTSPSSTVCVSLLTTPTTQSPKSDQSFDSQAPLPRPYYMPRITNLPGPLFESADDATSDHIYTQNKNACSSALPEVTANIAQVNNSCDPAKTKDYDETQQLLDATPLRVATNTLQLDTTSTNTYELLDETLPISDHTTLPEVTTNSTNKRLDGTYSSPPLLDATSNQLPDVMVVQVINDDADNQNQMEFKATIEYPVGDHGSESVLAVANTFITTNTTNVTTLLTGNTEETGDNPLLENNPDLDLNWSTSADSATDATNLKKCIIKLTDLSAEERNKWLGLTDKSSVSNLSTDLNNSRYYMRTRVVNMTRNNKRPGRKTTKHVNYHESPPSCELNDSDYEPTAKREKPLDNKRYPSENRIAMQKIINENKSVNQGIYVTQNIIGQAVIENTDETPTLPEATNVPNLSLEKPVATSSPKAKNIEIIKDQSDVPEATTRPKGGKQDPLLDKMPQANSVISGNANLPSVASVKPQSSDNECEKPRIVGIRRQWDPRAFKCSCCSKRTTTLKELNAHFIQNHRRVKCDICEEEFNTPSSLKKHKYTHCAEKYACRSCDREFPFEGQLRSHHHSHCRGRSYFCVYAGCNKSYCQSGDLNAHTKTHYTSLMTCEHCKYSMHDIRNLKSHMRKHTQVQTFRCKQCDHMFTHAMQLIRHRPKCDGKKN